MSARKLSPKTLDRMPRPRRHRLLRKFFRDTTATRLRCAFHQRAAHRQRRCRHPPLWRIPKKVRALVKPTESRPRPCCDILYFPGAVSDSVCEQWVALGYKRSLGRGLRAVLRFDFDRLQSTGLSRAHRSVFVVMGRVTTLSGSDAGFHRADTDLFGCVLAKFCTWALLREVVPALWYTISIGLVN